MPEILNKIEKLEYSQGIRFVRLFLDGNLNPSTACLLALLFRFTDYDTEQKYLEIWLKNYILTFMYQEPREVGDLREKTLAILAYYILEEKINQENILPSDLLFKYTAYAFDQGWYSDNFVAFFAAMIGIKNSVCDEAKNYFKSNYQAFIMSENIEAISQAIFVASSIDEDDIQEGLRRVRNALNDPTPSIYTLLWGVLALSKFTDDLNNGELTRANVAIYKIFSDVFTKMDSLIVNWSLSIIQGQTNIYGLSEFGSTKSIEREKYIDKELATIQNERFLDICLFVFVEAYSETNYLIATPGRFEKVINEFELFTERKEKGYIQISKAANIIGSILAILFTLLTFFGCFYYQSGLTFQNGEFHISSKISLGDWAILVTIFDYLISEIRAILRHDNAVEGMKGIPLVRQILHKG